jgi:hypothetical protein
LKLLKGIALGLLGFLLFVDLPLLGLSYTLNRTLLSPDFIAAETAKIDISTMAGDLLKSLAPAQFQNYKGAIDNAVVDLKPWIDQQTATVTRAVFDYLAGNSDKFDVTISTAQIKQSLSDSFSKTFLQSPPADYTALPAAQKSQYLAKAQQQFVDSFPIPASVELNADSIGASNMDSLNTARTIYGYAHTANTVLIFLSIIFILLIVAVLRELKGITRALGVILTIDGVLGYAAFYILKPTVSGLVPLSDLPEQVQAWVPVFINDVFSPAGIFFLVTLIVGLILLVSSFFFGKTKQVTR